MFKEKYENAKKFIKEHKTEIIAGTVCVGTTLVLGYIFKKNTDEIKTLFNKPEVDNKAIGNIKERLLWESSHRVDIEMKLDDVFDITNSSLNREATRIKFEIAELKNFIDNLDHTKTINIFHRIPEKEAMINELEIQLKDIEIDQNKIHDIMAKIWD